MYQSFLLGIDVQETEYTIHTQIPFLLKIALKQLRVGLFETKRCVFFILIERRQSSQVLASNYRNSQISMRCSHIVCLSSVEINISYVGLRVTSFEEDWTRQDWNIIGSSQHQEKREKTTKRTIGKLKRLVEDHLSSREEDEWVGSEP